MLSKAIQEALNKQVQMEAESSQAYLAMASWAEIQPGLQGVTEFFYKQSDEERIHMLKLIRFILPTDCSDHRYWATTLKKFPTVGFCFATEKRRRPICRRRSLDSA